MPHSKYKPSLKANNLNFVNFCLDSGPCSGDSGGGLFLPATTSNSERPRWHLRGIVSLSLFDTETQRCDLREYVVFTDVAKFQDWVIEVINKTKEMFPT